MTEQKTPRQYAGTHKKGAQTAARQQMARYAQEKGYGASGQVPPKRARTRALAIGGAVAVVLIAVSAVALALTQSAPEPTPEPEEPLVVVDTPTPPPAPTSWTFPLTGITTTDEAATLRRALSVKIENTPDARPQTGISQADVIYETVAEGGITRFNCLFQSRVPDEVGPVRSARLSDLVIVPAYDALFFFSGANPIIIDQIAAVGLPTMSHSAASSLYYRVDYRVAPHNLYLNLSGAWNLASEMGFATTTESPRALEFSPDYAEGEAGQSASAQAANIAGSVSSTARGDLPSATTITLPFSDYYLASWSWDTSRRAFLRSMDGPSVDAATNEQIGAANVVVLWAPYSISVDNLTFFIGLEGTGAASLFMDGTRIDGSWESVKGAAPRFKDAAGNPILLKPGTTWFEVLDINQDITVA
ncbi:MAG: DUF3048 domain-containing protein [Coriobacteriales bacterium]|nr:DUF3048 domain-containing protein [Coriobacteriales bacterium]